MLKNLEKRSYFRRVRRKTLETLYKKLMTRRVIRLRLRKRYSFGTMRNELTREKIQAQLLKI